MTLYIVAADRNPGVAALAQGHKVAFVVRAAVCKRQDVVHFLRRCQPTFAFTLLTQWMCLNITSTNPSPCAAVSLIGVRITQVSVVLMFRNLPVLVAEPTVGQSAAAREGAGPLGFVWHISPPKESKRASAFSYLRRLSSFFRHHNNNKGANSLSINFALLFQKRSRLLQRTLMHAKSILHAVFQIDSDFFPTLEAQITQFQ